jgi:hypothetical protein
LVAPRRFFPASRRSRDAVVGLVGLRGRGTASAARSFSIRRSIASSRLRDWLRSSCATARSVEPAREITRRFCTSDSASDASTSNSASTRVEDFWACCPPGPLDRETLITISETGRETERVTRIDSRSDTHHDRLERFVLPLNLGSELIEVAHHLVRPSGIATFHEDFAVRFEKAHQPVDEQPIGYTDGRQGFTLLVRANNHTFGVSS